MKRQLYWPLLMAVVIAMGLSVSATPAVAQTQGEELVELSWWLFMEYAVVDEEVVLISLSEESRAETVGAENEALTAADEDWDISSVGPIDFQGKVTDSGFFKIDVGGRLQAKHATYQNFIEKWTQAYAIFLSALGEDRHFDGSEADSWVEMFESEIRDLDDNLESFSGSVETDFHATGRLELNPDRTGIIGLRITQVVKLVPKLGDR